MKKDKLKVVVTLDFSKLTTKQLKSLWNMCNKQSKRIKVKNS
jgi:hypothetical protein